MKNGGACIVITGIGVFIFVLCVLVPIAVGTDFSDSNSIRLSGQILGLVSLIPFIVASAIAVATVVAGVSDVLRKDK
jgi:hypothetical protein